MNTLNAILDGLFSRRRMEAAARLRRILAADRVMRTHRAPAAPVFDAARYLWAARAARAA